MKNDGPCFKRIKLICTLSESLEFILFKTVGTNIFPTYLARSYDCQKTCGAGTKPDLHTKRRQTKIKYCKNDGGFYQRCLLNL